MGNLEVTTGKWRYFNCNYVNCYSMKTACLIMCVMNGKREDEYSSWKPMDVNVTNNCPFLRTIHRAILCHVPCTNPPWNTNEIHKPCISGKKKKKPNSNQVEYKSASFNKRFSQNKPNTEFRNKQTHKAHGKGQTRNRLWNILWRLQWNFVKSAAKYSSDINKDSISGSLQHLYLLISLSNIEMCSTWKTIWRLSQEHWATPWNTPWMSNQFIARVSLNGYAVNRLKEINLRCLAFSWNNIQCLQHVTV